MREEQEAILRMLHEGTVSREDAARLLAAIGMDDVKSAEIQSLLAQVQSGALSVEQAAGHLSPPDPPVASSAAAKWIRISVERQGKKPINIRVPIGLVDTGMHLFGGASMRVDGVPLDTQKLWEAVRSSAAGKIIEIDTDSGEHVEIIAE